jgi:type IV pilus assembly protein PilF
MRMGENRLAEESFRKAVSLSPRDGSVAHNLAWLLCQQGRYTEADPLFEAAANSPRYGDRAKTWMTQGICLVRAGQPAAAERVLLKAYELDAGNPVTGFNLARLTFSRGDHTRAQFYIRRINNSELANAETLWLGMRVEHRLQNAEAVRQLADQLRRRFPQSREWALYERGGLND